MKKIATLFLSLTVTAGLFAQTAEDALNFSQEYYEGTARSMAMGNAFTALGGDLGGLAINPAGSGVFQCSQFSFTPGLTTSRSSVGYLGNSSSTKNSALTISNVGTVLTFNTGNYTGLVNYNFGFVYNKKNNFRSSMKASGTTSNTSMLSAIANGLGDVYKQNGQWYGITKESLEKDASPNPYEYYSADLWPAILAWNAYALAPLYLNPEETEYMYIASTENYDGDANEIRIGGPLNQNFNRKTRGSNEEFALNFGGNISDFLYFGVNFNMHTLSQTTEEYYEEKAANSSQFQDGFVSMDNSYWLRTTGSGINFKFGAIVTPFAGLRLGATVTTPTWYTLTDEWDYTMNTAFDNGHTYTQYSPTGTYTYKLTAPMRWSVGAAYTFWDLGLVSVDYEQVNYANTKLREDREYSSNNIYSYENQQIASTFNNSHILRVGAEVRIGELFSLRGGYQYYSPAVKGKDYSVSGYAPVKVYSAGIGFNPSPIISIDLGWNRTSSTTNQFMLYDDYNGLTPEGLNSTGLNRVVCTFALKF